MIDIETVTKSVSLLICFEVKVRQFNIKVDNSAPKLYSTLAISSGFVHVAYHFIQVYFKQESQIDNDSDVQLTKRSKTYPRHM